MVTVEIYEPLCENGDGAKANRKLTRTEIGIVVTGTSKSATGSVTSELLCRKCAEAAMREESKRVREAAKTAADKRQPFLEAEG